MWTKSEVAVNWGWFSGISRPFLFLCARLESGCRTNLFQNSENAKNKDRQPTSQTASCQILLHVLRNVQSTGFFFLLWFFIHRLIGNVGSFEGGGAILIIGNEHCVSTDNFTFRPSLLKQLPYLVWVYNTHSTLIQQLEEKLEEPWYNNPCTLGSIAVCSETEKIC